MPSSRPGLLLAEQDAKAQAEYEQQVEEHLLRGGLMPSPPTLQLPEQAAEIRRQFMHEEAQLREERRKALAEVYPEVLRQAHSQSTKLVKAARPTVEKLAGVMAEVGSLLAAVQACRAAANAWNGSVGPRQFHDRRLTVDEFVKLAAAGADPTELLDLTGSGERRPLDPTGAQPRTTGITLSDISQLIEDTAGGGRVRK